MVLHTPFRQEYIRKSFQKAQHRSLIHFTAGKHMADEYSTDGRYFQSNNTSKDASSSISTLTKLFDTYRGTPSTQSALSLINLLKPSTYPDNPKDEPDTIGVEGSMRYLQDLGLSLEEPVVLAILTELAAPTMGELTRSGFIDGWKRLRYAPARLHPPAPKLPFS